MLLFITACAMAEASQPSSATDEPRVIIKDIFGLSSEGGYLQAIILSDEMQHLYIRLFGVMGQVGFNYSFFNDSSVIICITHKNYIEPFSLMPPGVLHVSSIDRERFLLLGDRLFIITTEDYEPREATEEVRNKIVEQMKSFISLTHE